MDHVFTTEELDASRHELQRREQLGIPANSLWEEIDAIEPEPHVADDRDVLDLQPQLEADLDSWNKRSSPFR